MILCAFNIGCFGFGCVGRREAVLCLCMSDGKGKQNGEWNRRLRKGLHLKRQSQPRHFRRRQVPWETPGKGFGV